MRTRRTLYVLAPLLVLLIAALPGYAQISYSTAAIQGTVIDEQGAAVPNATVTVSNSATGLSKTAKTGADGTYQILSLNPGTYRVEVEAQGFEKNVATSVVLTVGQLSAYDARLKVGAVSVIVEVAGNAAPLIETEQTQQANNINENQVEDLPNLNRNFTSAVYTLPGVANADAPRAQTPGFTGFFTTGFSIGGSNGRNNLSTIDGGENEYGTGQYRVATFPLDAIQEYQVNRSAFAAEFGFTDGAAINIVTKSGGNTFHGDAFGYFYDRYTNAQSYFYGVEHATDSSFSTQPFQQNIYAGGSIGGPLVKDKLFFFTSYEGQKIDAANPSPLFATCEVQGDLAPSFKNCPIVGTIDGTPTGTKVALQAGQLAYANQLIADGTLDGGAFGAALIDAGNHLKNVIYNPLANADFATVVARNNGTFDVGNRNNNVMGRLDYQLSASDSITLRLGYSHDNGVNTGVEAPVLRTRDYSILLNWTHSFSPVVDNQMLLQVVPWNRANATQQDTNSTQELLVGTAPNGGGIVFAGTSSYYPYLAHQRRYQAEDNVSWTSGAHTIKFGGSFRAADYHVFEPLWVSGQYVFVAGFPALFGVPPGDQGAVFFYNGPTGQCQITFGTHKDPTNPMNPPISNCIQGGFATGPTIANLTASNAMVANIPFNWEQGFGNPGWQGWGKYFGEFLQDTWKITHNFTLTPGIRFDYDGEPAPLHSSSYPSPRLGFSWDPMGDHKTVIRGGGGTYASPIDVLIPSYSALLSGNGQFLNVLGSQTFPQLTGFGPPSTAQAIWTAGVVGNAGAGIPAKTIPLGHVTGTQITALGFPTAPNTPGQTNQVIYNVTPNYKYPYSVEASLSIERELMHDLSLEVGYDMYHAVHQQMPLETAYGLANCATGALLGDNATAAQIKAAQIPVVGNCYAPSLGGALNNPNVTEQTTYASIGSSIYHGLTASLTKRYSHNFQFQANYTWSKSIDNFLDFASFQEWYRPKQLGLYRAISAFNVPQIFTFNAVYTTPRGGQGLLHAIYGNASISPVITLQSGLPYTLLTQSMANGPFGTAGTDIPGEDGNSATPFLEKRNSLSGLPFYTFNLSFKKGFYVLKDEKLRVDFSVQATNLLNRENFNNVADNITVANNTTCGCPGGVGTNSTTASLAGGQSVNLATGPFKGIHGVKPTSSSQFNQPGFFSPSGGLFSGANYTPRQVEFGLQLSF